MIHINSKSDSTILLVPDEIIRSPMFLFFCQFCGGGRVRYHYSDGVSSIVAMTFDKTEYLSGILIQPPKFQGDITQSSTKLAPKWRITTRIYAEEQAL